MKFYYSFITIWIYDKNMKKLEPVAVIKFRKKEDLLITFDELSEVPLNKVIQYLPDIEGAIEGTRISSNGDSLMFTVTMKKGQLWQKHNHDCIETILLYKGTMRELITDTVITKAETMTLQPYNTHYFLAEEDSIFYVEFKKPLE